MRLKSTLSGLIIFITSVVGLQYFFWSVDEVSIIDWSTIDWSTPKLLFKYPEEVIEGPKEIQGEIDKGVIYIVGGYRLMREDFFLEDSKVFLIKHEADDGHKILTAPIDDYPSEQPSFIRDNSGNMHLFWGDRRQDPDFEEWTRETRAQIMGFSTNVISSRCWVITCCRPVVLSARQAAGWA